jgi:hypothetical protein
MTESQSYSPVSAVAPRGWVQASNSRAERVCPGRARNARRIAPYSRACGDTKLLVGSIALIECRITAAFVLNRGAAT